MWRKVSMLFKANVRLKRIAKQKEEAEKLKIAKEKEEAEKLK